MTAETKTRRELAAVGRRRKKLRKMEEDLAKDTATAISHARRDKVPITEAAELVGLERTTIYQVYNGGSDGSRQTATKDRGSARSASANGAVAA